MKEVRYKEILKTLESQEVVKVTDLASQLNVTDMTIRRDLQELEEDYKTYSEWVTIKNY